MTSSSATPATSAAQRFSILADLGIFPQDSSAQPGGGGGGGAGHARMSAAATPGTEGGGDEASDSQYSMVRMWGSMFVPGTVEERGKKGVPVDELVVGTVVLLFIGHCRVGWCGTSSVRGKG